MRVLIISHNVLCTTTSMGKTLTNYFSGIRREDIAQLYFHKEIPIDDSVCANYYRFTDSDALFSAIPFVQRKGTVYQFNDIKKERSSTVDSIGLESKIYQRGRRRTTFTYFLRNFVWRTSQWFSSDLKRWIDEFNPECIFFASGDYSFSYRIASKIKKYCNVPMIISCVDDFYLYSRNCETLIGRIQHKIFMKTVKKTIKQCDVITTICEAMANDYQHIFNKKCTVLYTPSINHEINYVDDAYKVAYFGSIGVGRDESLLDVGRALKQCGKHLHIYSSESRPEVRKELTEENGIIFHKAITQDEMFEVLKECIAVVHVESFDEKQKMRVKYSISTKIPEALMYGPCLFAYGPSDIASIEYISENKAGIVCTRPEDLLECINSIFNSDRNKYIRVARSLAFNNHKDSKLKTILEHISK